MLERIFLCYRSIKFKKAIHMNAFQFSMYLNVSIRLPKSS